jgi:hypothetical protein
MGLKPHAPARFHIKVETVQEVNTPFVLHSALVLIFPRKKTGSFRGYRFFI